MNSKIVSQVHSIFISFIVISLLLTLFIPACAPSTIQPTTSQSPAAVKTTTMPAVKVRFSSHTTPPPELTSRSIEYFEKKVTELSGGQITFENFYSGSLVKTGEEVNAIQNRLVDMIIGRAQQSASKFPIFLFQSAFIFGPSDPTIAVDVKRKMIDTMPEFNKELQDLKIKGLWLQAVNGYNLLCTKPIKTLADMQGKKIAAVGTMMPKVIEAGGGTPVVVGGGERYESMSRGTIDGEVFPLDIMGDLKHFEVAKFFTQVDLGADVNMQIWANVDFWNSLTPEQQKIFQDVSNEVEKWHPKQLMSSIDSYKANAEKGGVTFIQLSDSDRQSWATKLPDLVGDWANQMESKGLPGWSIVNTYVKLTKEAGYKWPREWGKK